jgi:phosphatidylserine decarboxylase
MNSGKANKAAIRLILWSLAALVGLFVTAWVGYHFGGFILAHPTVLLAPWAIFIIAILYLSRDPDAVDPSDLNAVVSPAHGKVDVIEDSVESEFMKGACKRISIRVSLLDVQIQNAPVAGTVAHFDYRRAMKDGGTAGTENLLIGLDVIGRADTKVCVRLIGGAWGKRIVSWIAANDVVTRGVRIGMMRPASRVDLFLPNNVKLHVNVGDEVAGGQTVVAKFE